ncbi:hypothetical protein [Streptomyces sp. GZWMJZ-114]|uniref:hypothetical protein n=1 Tax=Streptomyces sp. GZWMJZ-114 TaxID=2494734 RepID=UPI001012A393|nr:hypothetical protein [Streptomyces sp. GZWMJZ-114]
MSAADELPEMPPIETSPQATGTRRRGRPKGATDKAPRKRTAPTASLEKRLAASLTTVGTVAALVSPADGMVVVQGVPALASALARVADENPSVKANLERMLTAGAWSGVLAALMPIVIGVMANHGAIPSGLASMLGAQAAADEAPAQAPAGAA